MKSRNILWLTNAIFRRTSITGIFDCIILRVEHLTTCALNWTIVTMLFYGDISLLRLLIIHEIKMTNVDVFCVSPLTNAISSTKITITEIIDCIIQ